jgi:hypothetical protein
MQRATAVAGEERYTDNFDGNGRGSDSPRHSDIRASGDACPCISFAVSQWRHSDIGHLDRFTWKHVHYRNRVIPIAPLLDSNRKMSGGQIDELKYSVFVHAGGTAVVFGVHSVDIGCSQTSVRQGYAALILYQSLYGSDQRLLGTGRKRRQEKDHEWEI